MLKLIGFAIKLTLFAAVVLVLGNWVHWKGKTVSDQVKSGMAQAEHTETVSAVRDLSRKLARDSQTGFQKLKKSEASGAGEARFHDQIPLSERQKLRALIQELNSSH